MFQFGSSVRYVRDVNLFSSSEFMRLDQCCQRSILVRSLHKSLFGSLLPNSPILIKNVLVYIDNPTSNIVAVPGNYY